MSTFMGRVKEFPDIQIDYFRRDNLSSPLACFLSHVHSDHLSGLANLRSPFVYCSAATKEILLRLETYACRVNYAKHILEAQQQTYKHLKKILKPLPLSTPTTLDLRPGVQIQVTLFDANHCPGAVMFLIEDARKAILYTGDIRSEPWFVNSLVRNPSLIEYSSGIRRLDTIYLDTSFTEEIPFQSKAEGIEELLRKVVQYPNDTIFHFQAWTYGYEEVWIALSRALKSRIHVDDYKLRIYNSLRARKSDDRFSSDVHLSPEAPALVGYMSGNTPQHGCLTSDCNVRLHSCERGNMCAIARGSSVVRIQPIIAHLSGGADLAEIGAGGGGGDLEREAELDLGMMQDVQALSSMIDQLSADSKDASYASEARIRVLELALESVNRRSTIPLHLDPVSMEGDQTTLLKKAVRALAQRDSKMLAQSGDPEISSAQLPRVIRFPYSRHSSYAELCHLLQAFRPLDVWPCTVSVREWLGNGISISQLFGKYCSGQHFSFDETVLKPADLEAEEKELQEATQATNASVITSESDIILKHPVTADEDELLSDIGLARLMEVDEDFRDHLAAGSQLQQGHSPVKGSKRTLNNYVQDDGVLKAHEGDQEIGPKQNHGFTTTLSPRHSIAQREAYYKMLDYLDNDIWTPIGLISTGDNHTEPDKEL
ncbi:hypothetical protein NLU13_6588 [Sarocladium strictum]|uniref:Metallo-beta-lactamase domain-containing protein n=1 Tax=Sarocladium strictum TaxID=5046 RepID=A0AA39GG60_SARSR|nr:hypothetical protein NLU13_6588 [Sarocladium strictum]